MDIYVFSENLAYFVGNQRDVNFAPLSINSSGSPLHRLLPQLRLGADGLSIL